MTILHMRELRHRSERRNQRTNKSQGVIWPQRKRTIDQRLPIQGLGGMESIESCVACRLCSRWRELRIP